MIIDKDVIRGCTEAANEFRLLSDATPSTKPTTPGTPRGWFSKNLRPKVPKIDRAEVESGYGTDTDASERYNGSPVTSAGRDGPWTRLYPDSPTSSGRTKSRKPPPFPGQWPKSVISWQPIGQATPASAAPENLSRAKRSLSPIDEDYDVDDDQEGPLSSDTSPPPRRASDHCADEENAAYLIMELHIADAALRDRRNKRRRFSL
jgi:hypothetical protein